jgi:hypothetical protein
MSEMKRLLDDPACDFDRVLLESALDDGPSPRSVERTLAALGVAGSIATIGSSAVGSSAVGSSAAVGSGAGASSAGAASVVAKAGLAVTLAKWLGVVAVSGAVAYSVWPSAEAPTVEAAGAPTVEATSVAAVQPASGSLASPGSEASLTEPAEPTRVDAPGAAEKAVGEPATSASPVSTGRALGSVSASPRAGTLTDEVAAIDAASRSLAAGDADAALTKLAAYRARFPSGQLAAEAAALRVQALAKKGDRSAADREAAAFKATYPGDPQETRVDEATRAP